MTKEKKVKKADLKCKSCGHEFKGNPIEDVQNPCEHCGQASVEAVK